MFYLASDDARARSAAKAFFDPRGLAVVGPRRNCSKLPSAQLPTLFSYVKCHPPDALGCLCRAHASAWQKSLKLCFKTFANPRFFLELNATRLMV